MWSSVVHADRNRPGPHFSNILFLLPLLYQNGVQAYKAAGPIDSNWTVLPNFQCLFQSRHFFKYMYIYIYYIPEKSGYLNPKIISVKFQSVQLDPSLHSVTSILLYVTYLLSFSASHLSILRPCWLWLWKCLGTQDLWPNSLCRSRPSLHC